MNIKTSLVLILILFIGTAAVADVFNFEKNIACIIPQMPVLKDTNCKFTQDKYIPSSNIHLKSSGDFKFEKNKGITFHTKTPVESNISYQSGEYRNINNILKAISEKNYSNLEADFKFYFCENNSAWTFGLKPKQNSKSAKYLNSVVICGKKSDNIDISKIIIKTFDNTITTIQFSK